MRILEICGNLNIGGAQLVAANISRYAENTMKFDYLVFGDRIGEYEHDVMEKGNRVLHIPEIGGRYFHYFKYLRKLMRDNHYDVVHCHTMFNCGIAMLAAKLEKVPGRLSHSHTISTDEKRSPLRLLYNKIMQVLIRICANQYLACGMTAGKVLYGDKWFARHGTVIPNGINVAAYQYSAENRLRIRKQYHWENSFVVGHVGHYVDVKNQAFLIQLAPEIKAIRENAEIVLFGEGENRERLSDEIKALRVDDYVHLMGNVDNIHEVLSAMDVFAFPSLYEGTPLALIEAQANGLPCIISAAVPGDACILNDIVALELQDEEERWVSAICGACRTNSAKKAEIVSERYGDVRSSMNAIYQIFNKFV